ncbi:cytochrome P450 [Chitinophaga qingshengii]|uniref:Cytochrome P450 n=1 Tax=Chitinophaga qingshengii TaxID=1569794 RepID=A0ABR7TFR0_9BACT|nr:cytochrome P450 [Chitinophaga qingshengii]MBC9929211.1 cytochrome P450 [Chitinophaga qingshengii]
MKTPLSQHPLHPRMQAAQPFFDNNFTPYFSDHIPGAWQITSYQDVVAVLSDYATFSSEYIPKTDDNVFTRNLNVTDPPKHKHLRALATKAFSPAIIAESEGWIRRQCEELLQPHLASGSIEFVRDFALQLPHRVISRLLGVPDANVEQVKQWIIAVAGDPRVIGVEIFGRSMQEMSIFFSELIKQRTAQPEADLISQLIFSEVEGSRLETMDVIAMCVAIFLGGYETTKSSLANALYIFAQMPDIQEHLAKHPEDVPKAVTEALRVLSPVKGFPRIAAKDTMVSSAAIKKGDLVNVSVSTANKDESVFAHPDAFDMDRPNLNQALSFGHGIHYCLGAPLARVETRIAFETIFSHARVRLATPAAPEPEISALVYSLKSLPLALDKI